MSAKDVLDKVITSEPVDSTAARVMRRGIHYDSSKRSNPELLHSENPLATQRPVTQEQRDLIGVKVGRMTVFGVSADRNKCYVVRCVCGRYELRRAKAIRNPNNSDDACDQCRHMFFLKRNRRWKQTGEELEWKDL